MLPLIQLEALWSAVAYKIPYCLSSGTMSRPQTHFCAFPGWKPRLVLAFSISWLF